MRKFCTMTEVELFRRIVFIKDSRDVEGDRFIRGKKSTEPVLGDDMQKPSKCQQDRFQRDG